MKRAESYAALAAKLDPLLGSCTLVNALPSREALERELAAGTLFYEQLPDGLLLFRKREGFARLSFCLRAADGLLRWQPEEPVVTELPFRGQDAPLCALAERLSQAGWTELLRRVRLSRKGGELPQTEPIPAQSSIDEAAEILQRCFSPLTGCLPGVDELAREGLLTVPGAALHYRVSGRQSEIRHLAVLPEVRGQGLARALVAAYLQTEGARLSRVWTAADNAPALHLYESFGYAPDHWKSIVLSLSQGNGSPRPLPFADARKGAPVPRSKRASAPR